MPRMVRKEDVNGGIDRISALPDELLIEILSFLSTKDAVATCVLSTRWRCVFTRLTRLEFDEFPICHCVASPVVVERFPSFMSFVDNVLRHGHHCGQQLTIFRLKFGKAQEYPSPCRRYRCRDVCLPEVDTMHLNAWICFPLTRGVKELDLCIRVRNPSKLPAELFCCRSLQVLKLDTNFGFEAPSQLCLPNLKVFHLIPLNRNQVSDSDSVTRLVSKCPSLEDLVVKGGPWRSGSSSTVLTISSQSLRRLVQHIRLGDDPYDFVLDTPKLQFLEYSDLHVSQHSLGHLSALVELRLGMAYNPTRSQRILGFFRACSNVQRLTLFYGYMPALEQNKLEHHLPVLNNLKQLVLYYDPHGQFNIVVVLEFLNHSPQLEILHVKTLIPLMDPEANDGGANDANDLMRGLSETQTVPLCLRSHLKRITIEECWGSKPELEIIEYFLRNTLILEEVVIVCRESVTIEERILLGNKLHKLPRGSETCSIIVE